VPSLRVVGADPSFNTILLILRTSEKPRQNGPMVVLAHDILTNRFGLSVFVASSDEVVPILYVIVQSMLPGNVSFRSNVKEVGVVPTVLCTPAFTPTPAMLIISPAL